MEPQAYTNIARIEQENWWYRGRRWVCQGLLSDYLRGDPRRRVLDVGCGTGFNLGWLKEWGEIHGVEPSEDGLQQCRLQGYPQVVQASAECLPYPDDHFGLVSALDIIEHIEDDVSALREIRRVLQPGGWLLIYTPALPWLYGEHDRIVHHKRRYTGPELRQKCQAADLDVVFFSFVNLFALPMVVLVKQVIDRLPTRPHTEMSVPAWPANFALSQMAYWEAQFLRRWPLPYGMSLVCLARKPK